MSLRVVLLFIVLTCIGSASASERPVKWTVEYKEGFCSLKTNIITKLNQSDNVQLKMEFGFLGANSEHKEQAAENGLSPETHIFIMSTSFIKREDFSSTKNLVEVSLNSRPMLNTYENSMYSSVHMIGYDALQILRSLQSRETSQITVTSDASKDLIIELKKSDITPKGAMYLACAENIP